MNFVNGKYYVLESFGDSWIWEHDSVVESNVLEKRYIHISEDGTIAIGGREATTPQACKFSPLFNIKDELPENIRVATRGEEVFLNESFRIG